MERACALLLVTVLASPTAHAGETTDCRNLLTLDEVAAAIGGAAELTNDGKRGDVGTGSVENERLEVCSWAMKTTYLAGVNLDVVPALESADVDKALAIVQYPLDERRRQHWTETKLDFGGVHCSSLSPPKPNDQEPEVTGCVGEVRGAALYVGISSRSQRPTFDDVKRLFDKAAGRL